MRFALVGVCYISEEYARFLVLLTTGTRWERNDFEFPVHVCVEPVVTGTQSCQNHLAWPVKKVVCILLQSGFQRCFGDGGLFLVMDAG